jgi:hypothetical protein
MDIDSGRQITTVMMTIVMRKQRMAEVMTTTAVVSSASIGWRAPSSGSGKNTRSHHKVPWQTHFLNKYIKKPVSFLPANQIR